MRWRRFAKDSSTFVCPPPAPLCGKLRKLHGAARPYGRVARALDVAVELRSQPGAAATMGPLWFQQMMAEVEAEFSDLSIDGILDCGDAPGYALAALRQGLKHIRLSASRATLRKIEEIARRCAARVETRLTPALDLAWEVDIEAACRAWMSRDGN